MITVFLHDGFMLDFKADDYEVDEDGDVVLFELYEDEDGEDVFVESGRVHKHSWVAVADQGEVDDEDEEEDEDKDEDDADEDCDCDAE